MTLSPLLLAYDHEEPRCRRWVAWVASRDSRGLVIPFPLQNPELARMAPELAGRPLVWAMQGVDAGSRDVFEGPEVLFHVIRRLPGFGAFSQLLHVPGASGLLCRMGVPCGLRPRGMARP